MKAWLRGFYYSLPIQLLFLHFRRYQVLLVFWFMIFLIFYFFEAWHFDHFKELIPTTDIIFLCGGFICGLLFILAISFIYFFGADRSILRRMLPIINNPKEYITHLQPPTVNVNQEH